MHFKKSIILPVVFICLWALVQYFFARPESIVNDWVGWRQADTQTIARNFLHNGGSILYPQINWGGNGPGYVESEFQLYTFLIAAVMRFTGEAEYPGQVLSLIFIGFSALVIYQGLTGYFGYGAGLAGMLVFLTAQGPVHLSTSVQPDALCFLFYAAGFFIFFKYMQETKISFLVLSTICAVFAGLIKPTALNLCAIQFLIIIFKDSNQLRNPRLWCSWVITVGIVSLYMVHGYTLYLTYGNTFGIIGGDSKFPTLQSLLNPVLYLKLFYMTMIWGIGPFGFLAGGYLFFQKKIDCTEKVLFLVNLLVVMVPFRYTTNRGYGPHYHIFTTLLSAWLVAHSIRVAQGFCTTKRTAALCLGFLILFQYASSLFVRNNPEEYHFDPSITCLGKAAAGIIAKKDLVIVRSTTGLRSKPVWGSKVNNYEDPRIFYLADISGWCLATDDKDLEKVKKYIASGARYYLELGNQDNKENEILYAWLQQHATLVFKQECGRIYKFI